MHWVAAGGTDCVDYADHDNHADHADHADQVHHSGNW